MLAFAFFSCHNLNAGFEPRVCGNLRDATPASATPASSLSLLLVHSLSSWFILSPPLYWTRFRIGYLNFRDRGFHSIFPYLGECPRLHSIFPRFVGSSCIGIMYHLTCYYLIHVSAMLSLINCHLFVSLDNWCDITWLLFPVTTWLIACYLPDHLSLAC